MATANTPLRHACFALAAVALASLPAAAQVASGRDAAAILQQHYDQAQNFQTSGQFPEAAYQYKLFISNALLQLAFNRTKAGDFAKASQYFDAATALEPGDIGLQLEYAEAALAAHDLDKARTLSQAVVNAEPKNAKAHRVLGRTLTAQRDLAAARIQLENAVALEPDFDNGYALAAAYLASKDEKAAAKVFTEMLTAFSNSAQLRMEFGRAYAQYGFPEQAILEFKKAIAKDPKTPGAHYSLGASYVLSMGEINFPQAVAEFHKELENQSRPITSATRNSATSTSASTSSMKPLPNSPKPPNSILRIPMLSSHSARLTPSSTSPPKPKPRFANRSTSRWILRAITTRCSARTIFSAAS